MVIALFGSVNHLGSESGTFAFFIVIAGVVTIETIFHEVHTMTHDTSYQDMVSAIEKELMIVGIMAYTGKVVFSTVEFSDPEWVHAVEFADLTIPMTSFMYCLIGLILIIRSARYYKLWSRAYNLKTVELLNDFFEDESMMWHFLRKYFINSRADEEVEFRILHRIFCDAYCIKDNAINFDQYVILNHEKYLLGLVTISPLSWLVLCMALMLNYLRVHLDLNFFECSVENYQTDDHSPTNFPTAAPTHPPAARRMFARMLGGAPVADTSSGDDHALHERHVCQAENTLQLYVVAGLILLFVTVVLAVLARLYVRRIMATKGIKSREDYAIFLQLYDVDENRAKRDDDKLDTKELSDALVIAKHAIDVERLDKTAEQYKMIEGFKKAFWVLLFKTEFSRYLYKFATDDEYEDVYDESGDPIRVRLVSFNLNGEEAGNSDVGGGASAIHGDGDKKTVLHDARLNTHITSETLNNMMELKNHQSLKITAPVYGVTDSILSAGSNSGSQKGGGFGNFGSNSGSYKGAGSTSTSHLNGLQATGMVPPVPGSRKRGGIIVKAADIQRLNLSHALKTSAKSTHGATLADSPLTGAFLFKNPEVYFLAVDSMVMLISFYLGLWITNFDSTAAQVEDAEKWRYLTLLPGLLSAAIFGNMVFTCSLLHAIVILDREVVEETIEKRADSIRVAQVLRDRLIEQLDTDTDIPPEVLLKNLFNVIDEDNSKFLTRAELQHFLQGIRRSFTKRRWDQIFHEIDANFDDEITFDELLLFVFPDVNAGQEQERRRLQAIGGHLRKGLGHMKLPEGDAYTDAMERICFASNLTPLGRDALFQEAKKQKSSSNLLAAAKQRSMRGRSFRDLLPGSTGAAKVGPRRSSQSHASDSDSDAGGHDEENPRPSMMLGGASARLSAVGAPSPGKTSRPSVDEGSRQQVSDTNLDKSISHHSCESDARNRAPSASSQKSDLALSPGQRSRAASEAATTAVDVLAFDDPDHSITPPVDMPSGRSRALTSTAATAQESGAQHRNRAVTDFNISSSNGAGSGSGSGNGGGGGGQKKQAFDFVSSVENAEIEEHSTDRAVSGSLQKKYSPEKPVGGGANSSSSSNIITGRNRQASNATDAEPEDMGFEEF